MHRSIEHSSQTDAPSMNTAPPGLDSHRMPAKRSPALAASGRQATSWLTPRKLTPSRVDPFSRGQVDDVLWMQTPTRGGSSDTGVNELAAMPDGWPSTRAHTAATPLGKHA